MKSKITSGLILLIIAACGKGPLLDSKVEAASVMTTAVTPRFTLINGTGVQIADFLVSWGNSSYTVWDSAQGASISYSSTGQVQSSILIYLTAGCGGQPYAAANLAKNTVISNNGSFYRTTGNIFTNAFSYYVNPTGGVICGSYSGTIPTTTLTEVVSYTNPSVPVNLSYPVSMVIQ